MKDRLPFVFLWPRDAGQDVVAKKYKNEILDSWIQIGAPRGAAQESTTHGKFFAYLGPQGDSHNAGQLVHSGLHALQGLPRPVEVQLLGGICHQRSTPARPIPNSPPASKDVLCMSTAAANSMLLPSLVTNMLLMLVLENYSADR